MSARKNAAVSILDELYERSRARAKSLGFTTWSAYVVQLIRADLAAGGGISVREDTRTEPLPPGRAVVYQTENAPTESEHLPAPRVCSLSANCPEACPILDRFDHRNPS